MCEVGCTMWGMPDSLIPRTVRFDFKPRTFGNHLVVVHVGAPFVCLGLPGKVINQSIVGPSPLSETAQSTGHDISY
jgi:hypothetical protein